MADTPDNARPVMLTEEERKLIVYVLRQWANNIARPPAVTTDHSRALEIAKKTTFALADKIEEVANV